MFDSNSKMGSSEMELVDFRIIKQGEKGPYEGIYGVNVAKVREIIKMPNLTELPGVPKYIDGIFDLRGVVIPVVNLSKWMNIKVPDDLKIKPRVIITEFSEILIGFIVHEAKRIRRISWENIEPANFSSEGGAFEKGKITGVTKIENDEVLLILDLESIVEELGIYSPKMNLNIEKKDMMDGVCLILDDSLTARKLLRDSLEKMGLRVIEAKDGVDGLQKMEDLYEAYGDDLEDNLKVIVSDIEMPLMDGYHFASKLKNNDKFKSIPIIFNSSLNNEQSVAQGEKAGADAYLTKFDATILCKEVMRVVNKHKNIAK